MSGYKYRDPVRAGQPVFTQTDKRLHDLEQENAQLRDRMKKFESLANQWAKVKAAALKRVKELELEQAAHEQTAEALRQRVLELGQERDQAVERLAGRVEVNHDRVRHLLIALRRGRAWPEAQRKVHQAVLHTMSAGYAADNATNRDRVRSVLGTLRAERQVLAGERSRRQHAEQALSRSEERTDKVRTELDRERTTHRQTVVGLQETVAGLEETIGELRARLAQRHEVVTENRVAQLQGALADQQQITADRTRERDMARGEAIGAYSLLDQAHTLLTRKQIQVFEAKRLANVWGIPFEQPESEVA